MNLKSVFKGVLSSALAFGLIVGAMPAFAESTESSSDDYAASGVITPYDMDVASGKYSGTEFQATYSLKSSNGKNVNFWVENTGDVSVKITINGKNEKTLAPGKNGHITASVGIFSSDYKFKAVPGPNGGEISINYRIAQRD